MIVQDVTDQDLHWKTQVFDHFMQIVKSPYANFQAIGKLADSINNEAGSKQTLEHLYVYPVAKYAIDNRLSLGSIDLQQLHSLPINTLGYAYSDHLLRHGLTPIQSKFVDNNSDYLFFHLSEVHDIWHVVVGADTTMEGETKLQAFVASQLQSFRFAYAMLAKNLLKTSVEDIELADLLMDALAEGWLLGKQAHQLFGIQWNTLWHRPLIDLQKEFNIVL